MWPFKRSSGQSVALALADGPVEDVRIVEPWPVLDLVAPTADAVSSCQAIRQRLRALPDDGQLAVVGESDHQDALRQVAGGRITGSGEHVAVTVALVPEEHNRWDHNAVRVDAINGYSATTVGYLPVQAALSYQPELLALRDAGYIGTCPARISGGGRRRYELVLDVAPVQALQAVVSEESGGVSRERDGRAYLRADWSCELAQPQLSADVLAEHAPDRAAGHRRMRMSLAFCTVRSGEYRDNRAIEVRFAGTRVGLLTSDLSVRYGGMVEQVLARGLEPVCTAVLWHEPRGLRVELKLPAVSGHFPPGDSGQ